MSIYTYKLFPHYSFFNLLTKVIMYIYCKNRTFNQPKQKLNFQSKNLFWILLNIFNTQKQKYDFKIIKNIFKTLDLSQNNQRCQNFDYFGELKRQFCFCKKKINSKLSLSYQKKNQLILKLLLLVFLSQDL